MQSEICAIGGRRSRPTKFKERSQAIVKQYSEYEPLPGLHVNGELTQGENIADIGGVKIAYAALQKALAEKSAARRKSTASRRSSGSFSASPRFGVRIQRDEDLKLMAEHEPAFARALSGERPAFGFSGISEGVQFAG